MKARKNKTVGILLASLLILVGLAAAATVWAADDAKPAGRPGVAKWQHLALTHDLGPGADKQDLARTIVKLGQEGWQLVSVANVTKAGTTTKTVFYFKRPL